MRPLHRTSIVTLALALPFFFVACGGGSDAAADANAMDDVDATEFADEGGFDESQLPSDFPSQLIPPQYESGTYTDMGSVSGAAFESNEAVDDMVGHYVGLLGDPDVNAETEDGGRNANWHDVDGWIVGVLGDPSESIISVMRNPNTGS